jgi:hypothetical protein
MHSNKNIFRTNIINMIKYISTNLYNNILYILMFLRKQDCYHNITYFLLYEVGTQLIFHY